MPKALFNTDSFVMGVGTWDVRPDGNGFLMIKEPEPTEEEALESAGTNPTQINIVVNWIEELKQRVPIE
jgi:hypothetical protein